MSRLFHVDRWAIETGASRDAIYDLRKFTARLGMPDDDLGILGLPAALRG